MGGVMSAQKTPTTIQPTSQESIRIDANTTYVTHVN